MPYQIERFGWLPDPPDHRDRRVRDADVRQRLTRVLPRTARGVAPDRGLAAVAAAPGVGALRADLRQWCSAVEDQGNVGSCTAQAVVGAVEYFQRKTGGQHVEGSRLFLYRVTRRFLGWEGRGDTGAFVRSAIKALRLFGVVPEKYFPYDAMQFDREPDSFHYAFAQNFKALEYFRLDEDIEHLKSSLDAGLPFAFGFTCFSSLHDPDVGKTGVIKYPQGNESVIGGHAVLAVGYTDSHVLLRNSWGRTWGEDGYGYLPWSYFDQTRPLATDCWALVNAAWVPEDDADTDYGWHAARPATPAAVRSLAMRRAAAPSGAARRGAEPGAGAQALVRVVRGVDPLETLPLRLSARGVTADAPDAPVTLPVSKSPVALYLKSLRLLQDFDFALFGNATDELYVAAVAWDLSGQPPIVFPSSQADALKGVYSVEPSQEVRFIGDGLLVWPQRPIVGGLYVRLLILENDDDVRNIGQRLAQLRATVAQHELAGALAALAAGPTGVMINAVVQAAASLAGVIGAVMQQDGDDLVALFDGTYGAEHVTESRRDVYTQAGASIELSFEVQT